LARLTQLLSDGGHQLVGHLLRLALCLATHNAVTCVIVEEPEGDLVQRRLDGWPSIRFRRVRTCSFVAE
jgi:hypothetical protein